MEKDETRKEDKKTNSRRNIAIAALSVIGAGLGSGFGVTLADSDAKMSRHREAVGAELDSQPVGPGTPETIVVPGSASQSERQTEKLRIADAQYARRFAEDEAAGYVDTEASVRIHQLLGQLVSDGYEVEIHVTGYASAEDDSSDDNAGMQHASKRNERLANTRRDSFLEYMESQHTVPDGVTVVPENGQEGSVSDRQLALIVRTAQQHGYKSPGDMIRAWNDGTVQDPAIDGLLKAVLDKDRSVALEIIATRTAVSGEPATETVVCVVPVVDIITQKIKMDETTDIGWRKIYIPIGALLGGLGLPFLALGSLELARDVKERRRFKETRNALRYAKVKTRYEIEVEQAGLAADTLAAEAKAESVPVAPETPTPKSVETSKWSKWRKPFGWLLPPIIAIGLSLGIGLKGDKDTTPTHPNGVSPDTEQEVKDPCPPNAPHKEKVVGIEIHQVEVGDHQ